MTHTRTHTNTQTRALVKLRLAFTLAEVLIVVGIIGLVAEMTIPTLMHNVQDQALKTMWKKEYSMLSQVVTQMINDNGGSLKGVFTDNQTAKALFKNYLSIIKECDDNSSFGVCWASDYKTLSKNTHDWANGSGLILKDGASLMMETYNGLMTNCDFKISNQLYICGYIPVDVNGPLKGPNVIGRDIFSMWILENKTLPEGCSADGRNNCNTSGTGTSCSALYLYD